MQTRRDFLRSTGAFALSASLPLEKITPGKLADLVVIGRDPLPEHPSSLLSIPIERTMVGGRWVFEA